MEYAKDQLSIVHGTSVKTENSDLLGTHVVMQGGTTQDGDFSKTRGYANEILKTSQVFCITRPDIAKTEIARTEIAKTDIAKREELATGVFRVTRPAIMKNADISNTPCSLLANETISSQPTSNKQIGNNVTGLHTGQNVIQTRVAFVNERTGIRKEQLVMPRNNQSVVLLPRPQNRILPEVISGTHIQRIPVLNNTYEQSSFANNNTTTSDHLNLIPVPNALYQGKPEITMSFNESDYVRNTGGSDFNNNSRVRNAQKFTKVTEAEIDGNQTLDKSSKITTKLFTSVEVREESMVKALSSQNISCEQPERKEKNDMTVGVEDIVSADTESCSKTNHQIEYSVSESVPRNIPSTSQCLEESSPCNVFKKVQQNLPIKVTQELPDIKPTLNECKTNNTLELDEAIAQRNKESLSEKSVINATRKGRKRTYRDTKHADNDETIQEVEEMCKKSYLIRNNCSHKITAKTQEETESKPIPKNSKAFQDIESRYMRHDLSGSSSVEKVFEDKCDIINKVESEKLSEVKDHHLLKLSDNERQYLRSKCYLDNELVKDVRRRFETGPENKNEMTKSTEVYDKFTQEREVNENLRKETNDLSGLNTANIRHVDSFGDEMSSNNDTKDKINISNTKEKHWSKQMGNEKQVKCQFTDHLQSYGLKQPVVRLQHLECLPSTKKPPAVIDKSTKQQTVKVNQNITDSMSTPSKVYYVVNSNELAKLSKQRDNTRDISCAGSNIFSSSTKIQSTNGAAVTKDVQVNTICSKSVNKTTSPSSEIIQKKVQTPTSNINNSGGQLKLEPAITMVNTKICNTIKQIANNSVNQQKTYSNKLTVKELLEAKRDDSKSSSATSRQTFESTKRIVSLPLQLYGRAAYGKSHKKEQATINSNMKVINSNIAMNVMTINTGTTGKSHVQTARTIHIMNPKSLKSTSVHQHTFIAPKPQMCVPDDGSTKTDKDISPVVHSSNDVQNIVNDKKSTYFKMGNQTVIVKRSEEKPSSRRKTLPAPKSKRTIADDYKRRRRRSRDRFTQMHRKSIGSNLKKMIKESDNSVFKMMYSLDLIPIEILNKISAADRQCDSEPNTPIKNHICQNSDFELEMEEKCVENISSDRSRPRKRKSNVCKESTNMANIMQIIKLEDESVTFSIDQIKVQYRKPGSERNHTSFANAGSQCRIKFSADGIIEKIYVETLGQGLYLVKNTNGDKIKLANRQKINTYLVPYPPYIYTIPNGSLSIAVGEIYPEQKQSQYTPVFKNEDQNVQTLLDKFLFPLAPLNDMDDFLDKRYNSITDKSMSPRCSSPMFYSKEMRNAFDDFIEDGTVASEYTKINMSRRSETNLTKLDLQTTRFSERAMALKIKQNELFESCRKLKSESTIKVGLKKKRDKRLLIAAPRTENIKNKDDIGVRVLTYPHGVIDEDKKCSDTKDTPKEANDIVDKIIDVDV